MIDVMVVERVVTCSDGAPIQVIIRCKKITHRDRTTARRPREGLQAAAATTAAAD